MYGEPRIAQMSGFCNRLIPRALVIQKPTVASEEFILWISVESKWFWRWRTKLKINLPIVLWPRN
jgi:hypothetical protein